MVTEKFLQGLKQGDEETRRQLISQQQLPLDPQIVPIMIDCLVDPCSAVCEAAVDALGHCSDPASIGLIVFRLYSQSPVERNYVLEVIEKIGNPALASVIVSMNDADRNTRKQAIDALIVIASEETFFPLIVALKDADPIVASSAAEALGQLHFQQAVPYLKEALKNDCEWIKVAALTSLGNIGGIEALRIICSISNDQPDAVLTTAIQAVASAAAADYSLAIDFLLTLLKQARPAFEGHILCILEPMLRKNNHLSQDQKQLVITTAHKFLDLKNPSLCVAAIKILALMSNFQAGELFRFAESANLLVRSAALQAMLLSNDIDIQRVASMALDSAEQNELRIQSLRVLAKNPEWNVTMEAQLFAIAKQDDIRIRIAAINTLLQWKSERGIIAFLKLFDDEDNFDEEIFIAEFELDSANVFVELIKIGFKNLDNQARYRMFHALFTLESKCKLVLNPKTEYDILLNALQDSYWAIRVHAIRLYGKKYTQNGNILALMAKQDPDERVRTIALNILNQQNKLSQELLLLMLHDDSLRVHRAILLIILGMDSDKISLALQTEVLNISSSISEGENNEFSDLFREIKRKFINERI